MEQNFKKAAKLLERAANQGSAHAMIILAQCFERGQGVKKDLEHAGKLYWHAAQLYDSAWFSGLCLALGRGTECDPVKAAECFKLSSEDGSRTGLEFYGYCLEYGFGVEPDVGQAIANYESAVELGGTIGMVLLGKCYEEGRGALETDTHRAFELYKHAADAGDPHGYRNLLRCVENGIGELSANDAERYRAGRPVDEEPTWRGIIIPHPTWST